VAKAKRKTRARRPRKRVRVRNPFSEAERDVIRPRPELMPSEYAERHLVIGRDSPVPGPFCNETMPHLRSVMDSQCDPRYDMTVLVAGTQSGKSLAGNQIPLAYNLEYLGEYTGLGVPNAKLAKRKFRTKLRPMFDAVPRLARLLPTEGAGSRGGIPSEMILKNGAVFLPLGAGSDADMSETTIHKLILDETDKMDEEKATGNEATPCEQMIARTDAHRANRHIWATCTPTVEDGWIWVQYLAGSRGKPWYPCPRCGQWIWFEWSFEKQLIGWDDDTDELSVGETAYYPCPHCEHKIREAERVAMIRHPLWIHEGERVERCSVDEACAADAFDEAVTIPKEFEGAVAGWAFRAAGERKRTRTVSFWWNKLSVTLELTLGDMAREAYRATEDERRQKGVCIYHMALPWSGDVLDASEVSEKLVAARLPHAGYRHGPQMPFKYDPARIALTGGFDVGKRQIHGQFSAWEVDGERRCLQSWRLAVVCPYEIPNPDSPSAIYDALMAMRAMAIEGWRDSTGREIPLHKMRVGIDSGYQHHKKAKARITIADMQVYNFCLEFGQKSWRPTKGELTLQDAEMIKTTEVQHGRRKVLLRLIDTDLAKGELHALLKITPADPGYYRLPADTPALACRGMAAERRVIVHDKRGNEVAEWRKVDPYNHPFDAAVIDWAMARSLGVRMPPPTFNAT